MGPRFSNIRRRACFLTLILAIGCRPRRDGGAPPAPVLPAASGTLTVSGLSALVTVARDRHGIPHITAANADDLFFAQGFVQAQDRLFQMDLWRRSVQGRLSEVLGSNFYGRDTMTRRIQYHGDIAADWASSGPDTEAIAKAFVRGVNAWVDEARKNPPEEFRLAGWMPESWNANDLLNRTDAFLSSTSALDEVVRARLTSVLGATRVDALLPLGGGVKTTVSRDLDLGAIGSLVGDQLRRVGTSPFFLGLMAPVIGGEPESRRQRGSNAWVITGDRTASGKPIVATDPHRPFDHPSGRYLVHLTAPGWNVIGATAPWLPGVAIGHNDAVAWGMAAATADVQDIYVEHLDPADDSRVEDRKRFEPTSARRETVAVRGQAEPWEFEIRYTPHGVLIGVDRDRRLGYSLNWIGFEPGTANELAALSLDRAQSAEEFRRALARWKSPVVDVVFADRDSTVGQERAGLVPVRRGSHGAIPAAGWDGANGWTSFAVARDPAPRSTVNDAVAANGSPARTTRIRDLLATAPSAVPQAIASQRDVLAQNALALLPLLVPLNGDAPSTDALRLRLLAWDRRVTPESEDAALYVAWEQALRRRLAERQVPGELAADLAQRLPIVSVLAQPSSTWFGPRAAQNRDALLLNALGAVAKEIQEHGGAKPWGETHRLTFAHPLGIGDAARRRFNVGPLPLPGYPDTVFATSMDGASGPSFAAVFDVADWDRSVAINAPGQSGSPASPHFADLAKMWAAGEYFALPFTAAAVRAETETTLTLIPK